jgi:hypothetical protein
MAVVDPNVKHENGNHDGHGYYERNGNPEHSGVHSELTYVTDPG